MQILETLKYFSTDNCNVGFIHRSGFKLQLEQFGGGSLPDRDMILRPDIPLLHCHTAFMFGDIPIHSLYPLRKLPGRSDAHKAVQNHTIILCNVRTVASAQHGDLLPNLCDVVIATLKINLLISCRDPTLNGCGTSLMATTSPVSL